QTATPSSYNLNAGNLFNAAKDTVYDLSSICDRNPAVCETGQAALETFGNKARYGAKMVMDFISERDSAAGDVTTTPVSAPARGPASATPNAPINATINAPAGATGSSQNTLNSSDLEPTWGGPLAADNA
ncbi:MAG: DUF5330 domain-containing protein, partial [Fimbriimonadaceae bacterium]|nr:DUF5330 domain-containing protein [Alphaproteobacteria bacterium]